MRSGRRIGVAIGVLVVLAGAAGAVWWYQYSRAAPGPGEQEVTAIVSNGNDRGPGTLREALFVESASGLHLSDEIAPEVRNRMARAFKKIRDEGGSSAFDRDQLCADVEACIGHV